MPPRFLLIDQDAEFRRLLRERLLAEWPDAKVVERAGDAGGAPDARDVVEFDAVLLGHPFGNEQGFTVLRVLRGQAGCPPVILFAKQSDEFFAVDALKAGAANFFPKARIEQRRLIDALRAEMGSGPAAGATASSRAAGARGFGAGAAAPLRRAPAHRMVAQLYSGDLASVYLAEPVGGGPRVAYKVLRHVPDAGGGHVFDRFLQEYEALARLRHPNVVRIHSLGVADDHAYIAMEYLDAGSLAERLGRPLAVDVALGYVRQIAAALEAIHAAGILHRDLKPANVMFRSDGSLALIDFGLAKQVRAQAAITGVGQIFGTPHYMSPEQGHAGETDARSDIYSLGCMLYEMLTGRRPFEAGSPLAVIYRHANAPRPELPGALARLQPQLDRMLAVDPVRRYQSATALLTALQRQPVL